MAAPTKLLLNKRKKKAQFLCQLHLLSIRSNKNAEIKKSGDKKSVQDKRWAKLTT